MRPFQHIRRLLAASMGRARLEAEMDAEMRHHLELEVAERVRGGMSPAEARRTALRDFGGVERWKEEGRMARGLGGWDSLRQDLRYAVRTLRGSPAFTAVSVATLTVAIGATTAVFGVVEALLIEPLDYREADRVVRLLEHRVGDEQRFGTTSGPNFHDWVARAETLGEGSLYDEYSPTLRLGDRSMKLSAASVEASYFRVLGVEPAVGRFFLPEEDEPGSSRVVLSWGLWQEAFGADPEVVGRTIDLSGFPYTVVGVAQPFEDPGLSGASSDAPRLWRSTPRYFTGFERTGRSVTGIARLEPGVTVALAEAELNAIHGALAEEHAGNRNHVVQVRSLKEVLVGDVRPVLWLLLAAVGLVLLIACANVANLLLFRSAGRAREMAVRTAVGASRGRVVRQLLVESVLLGAAGSAGGVALALLVNRGLRVLAAGQLPRAHNLGVDVLVLGFAVAAGLVASMLFGLLPALHTVSPDTAGALREGGRGSAGARSQGRLRSAVVAAQVGLAVVVLIGAGLLGRSLLRLAAVDPGLATDRTLVFRIDPPFDPYGPTEEDGGAAMTALLDRLTQRLGAIPGVERVSSVDLLPMSGSFNGNAYLLEGRPEPSEGQSSSVETRAVGAGYFEAQGITVLDGPDVSERRRGAPRVAWINEAMVRREGADAAVGKRIRMFGDWFTIVGVVRDVAQFGLDREPEPNVFLPRGQAPVWMQSEPWMVIRTAGDPAAILPLARAALADVDPSIPVYGAAAMDEVVSATLARPRFRTVLLLSFAGISFLLGVIGIYGMVSYTVARRLPELGVRMALGADARHIRRHVVVEGLRPVLIGAALGLIAGLAASRLLQSFLFGVSATDPLTYVAAPLIFVVIAALAARLPARRAERLALGTLLRAE